MATLIIPDIHERIDRLHKALDGHIEKADRVVFLGDHFDAFGPRNLARLGEICRFINGNIDGYTIEDAPGNDNTAKVLPATFLLGNHDCHYFFDHNGFKCSGYDPVKHQFISANIPGVIVEKFRIFTRVGPYLVSHAGFTEATLPYAKLEVEEEAIRTALAGGFDPIFGAGRARGGWLPVGGPTWLDWSAEFEHIDDMPQIVGHTQGKDVRTKGTTKAESKVDPNGDITVDLGLMSYCLDTALRNCAFVDEETGKVTIEEVA